MKKALSLLLVIVSLGTAMILKAKDTLAYEISRDRIVLSKESPHYSIGTGNWIDPTKIQSAEFPERRGGFIRLETKRSVGSCFSLKIFQVPDGMSIDEAMPFINNLPLIAELNGNEGCDLKPVKTGKYIYVLTSTIPYLLDYQVEERGKYLEEVRVIMSAKLSGSIN